MKKYDLIVVGAGPSGLLAAKAAGNAGLEVALVDRKSDLTRLERTCGQTMVSMNEYYFGDLTFYNPKGKRFGFSKNGVATQRCNHFRERQKDSNQIFRILRSNTPKYKSELHILKTNCHLQKLLSKKKKMLSMN